MLLIRAFFACLVAWMPFPSRTSHQPLWYSQLPACLMRKHRPCERKSLYRAGNTATALPACSACHLPNGAGVPSNFPRLSGQHAEYTYAQLKAFKSGERGNDKDGIDVNGKIMRAIAQRLDDAQMKALADFSAGLR